MAKTVRLIARLDIKAPNLIKGIHLEGLRVLGDPYQFARKYYESGVDELIYMDIVASLYERNSLIDLVKKTAQDIFIPFTVGGGIRSVEDAQNLLWAGADKIAINTAAVRNPSLITDLSRRFGSQCVVLSIEAKRSGENKWEAFTDNGREHTERDAVEWAIEGWKKGAGEILVTSVDQEGTRKGFDVELTRQIAEAVPIPVIASGGMGELSHLNEIVKTGKADAVAMADILHYERESFQNIQNFAQEKQIPVRLSP